MRTRLIRFLLLVFWFFPGTTMAQGDFWQATNGPNAGRINKLILDSVSTIYAGTETGVFRSTNQGASWTPLNTGLTNLHVTDLLIASSGTMLAGTSGGGVFRSTNAGALWTVTSLNTRQIVGFGDNKCGVLFTGIGNTWDNNSIWSSTDDGLSWTYIYFGWSFYNIAFVDDHEDGTVFFGSPEYDMLGWRDTNNTSWMGQPVGTKPCAITRYARGRMFVGGASHLIMTQGAVARSVGHGPWIWLSSSLGLPFTRVSSIAVDTVGRLFAGTDSGAYESVDNGYFWRPLRSGMDNAGVGALVTTRDAHLLGGGTNGTVYRSVLPTIIAIPPCQVYPPVGARMIPQDLTLSWTSAAFATSYQVQISPDSTFSSDILFDSSPPDTFASAPGLPAVSVLYWSVRTRTDGGYSEYSYPWRFITGPLPPRPTLASPPDSSVDMPLEGIRFIWRRDSHAIMYHFTLYYGNTWDLTDTTFVLPSSSILTRGTTYLWWVSATNISGDGLESDHRIFTTIPYPPGATSLLLPRDRTMNLSTNLGFSWASIPAARTYHLQVSSDSTFVTGMAVNDSSITTSSSTVPGLGYSTTYYWRVRGGNGGGWGPFSPVFRFTTTVRPPSAPALMSPQDGALYQSTRVSLEWSTVSTAWEYHMQVSTDSTFSSGWVVNDSSITTTAILVIGLPYSTTFYWHVRCVNIGGWGPFSPIFRFTTTMSPPPIVSPLDDSRHEPPVTFFTWRRVPGADRYPVQIGYDSLLTHLFRSTTENDTNLRIRLLPGKMFFWRVAAADAGGQSEWSHVCRMQTIPAGNIERVGTELPVAFHLFQNYPNPFNLQTNIQFDIPATIRVTLSIYAVNGQEVARIFDSELNQGSYRVNWSGQGCSTGMYIARIVAGNFVSSEKILFLK